jgi:diketogulonate reductase-like aldo/keto reductase
MVLSLNLSIESTIKLNNGIEMPIIGLGTWALGGDLAQDAVIWAVEAGYRLIDTASLYGNEGKIGDALQDLDSLRKKLFITTKVWNTDHGYESTLNAFEKSLKRLKLEYIDLYLIHWPTGGKLLDTWRALEKIYEEGKARAIGVSNFTIHDLKDFLNKIEVYPAVNQVEFSPFLYQRDLLEYCHSRNIRIEAYSPLTRKSKLNDKRLSLITRKYAKTPAQVLIRWGLQHEVIEIPKSGNKQHLHENANVFDFDISAEDMQFLDNLNENHRIVEDPHFYRLD